MRIQDDSLSGSWSPTFERLRDVDAAHHTPHSMAWTALDASTQIFRPTRKNCAYCTYRELQIAQSADIPTKILQTG